MLVSVSEIKRRYPIGAEVIGDDQTHFRVWGPKAQQIDVVLEDNTASELTCCPLKPEADGYFSGTVNVGAVGRYRFRVNGGENLYPGPASRSQPEGPHGPSGII